MVPVAVVGAARLCICGERLAHVRWELNCTCRWPNCTCVCPQPRMSLFPRPYFMLSKFKHASTFKASKCVHDGSTGKLPLAQP
eukprot:13804293-Alexandrium_andersonii.AAC.1